MSTISSIDDEAEPKWQGELENCFMCKVSFSTLTRRHHCRQCGACVCNGCSNHKVSLDFKRYNGEPQRVCSSCFDFIKQKVPSRSTLPSPSSSSDWGTPPCFDLTFFTKDAPVSSSHSNVLTPARDTSSVATAAKRAVGIRTRIVLDAIDDLNQEVLTDFMVRLLSYSLIYRKFQMCDIHFPSFLCDRSHFTLKTQTSNPWMNLVLLLQISITTKKKACFHPKSNSIILAVWI